MSVCRSKGVCGRRQSEGGSCTGAADRMVLELQAEAGYRSRPDSSGLTQIFHICNRQDLRKSWLASETRNEGEEQRAREGKS